MTRFDPSGDLEFQLDRILNDGIEFNDNIQGRIIEFETSDGEEEIQHDLGFVPIGWFKIFQDAEVSLWSTRREDWTNSRMFLKSNASKVTVKLFVL